MHDGNGTAGNYTIAISEVSVNAGVPGEVIEICYGETANLFMGIANYQLGGEWIPTSPAVVLQGNLFNSTDYASQTYTFNYTVSDGCAVDQALATVNVHAAPSAGQDGTINVCLHEPFDLLLGLGGNVDFGGNWYDPSNAALASNLDTAGSLAGSYNYDYIVTSQYCPNDTSNVMVIVDGSCDYTASLSELEMDWVLYPNPATDVIMVQAQSSFESLILTDLQGKELFKSLTINSSEQSISVKDLAPGIYTIRIVNQGKSQAKRFVKQ
jgi:hypothetical protein